MLVWRNVSCSAAGVRGICVVRCVRRGGRVRVVWLRQPVHDNVRSVFCQLSRHRVLPAVPGHVRCRCVAVFARGPLRGVPVFSVGVWAQRDAIVFTHAENRVIGNLVVEQDPLFGGGTLSVSGAWAAIVFFTCACHWQPCSHHAVVCDAWVMQCVRQRHRGRPSVLSEAEREHVCGVVRRQREHHRREQDGSWQRWRQRHSAGR